MSYTLTTSYVFFVLVLLRKIVIVGVAITSYVVFVLVLSFLVKAFSNFCGLVFQSFLAAIFFELVDKKSILCNVVYV